MWLCKKGHIKQGKFYSNGDCYRIISWKHFPKFGQVYALLYKPDNWKNTWELIEVVPIKE